jgi:flagellin-like hook-associated protein FlgL
MIYRTAHRATYRELNQNLGSLSYRIAQLTSRIASERRINTPSDDPSGAAKVLGTRSTLSNIAQYSTNLAVSDLWLADSGNAVQAVKEALDQIYVQAEQGATDSYNAEQRQIMADQVSSFFDQLIQLGDTQIGESYIFGGRKVTNQPFSLKVEAQKVTAGCQNSTKWTGKAQNYGDPVFNSRPDLPVQSQNFLVEVVQAGGVDSRYYANTSDTATGFLSGEGYGLTIRSGDKAYNNIGVKVAAGPEPRTSTGLGNSALTWGGTISPTKIVYTYGDSTGTTVSWDNGAQTLTVALETDADGASVATANDVADALNNSLLAPGSDPLPAAADLSVTVGGNGAGLVDPVQDTDGQGRISYNYGTYAEPKLDAKGNIEEIVVYLQRDNATGALVADAAAVKNAIDQVSGGRLNVTVTENGLVAPQATAVKMEVGVPYTLAQATANPKGTQNDLVWSIKNNTANVGAAGNNFSVEYLTPEKPFASEASVSYDAAANKITVTVAADEALYEKIFVQVYNDPESGAFHNADQANEMALAAAVTTTANEVLKLVENHREPDGTRLKDLVEVRLADGNSGEGKVNKVPRTYFSEGYDQPALFRVSQDGGQTWGPPMSFSASEYQTGDMFYNAYLGHASLTTSFPGQANDLVFTAKQMGTWGNDLRVEYQQPKTHPSDLSVSVGPNPWNICVNLATDADGQVISTAKEVMLAVNSHPVASQLVNADLANYHEGGDGLVSPLDCRSLSVGEPYQVNGKTVITPLGHATATVDFNYTAGQQKCPNLTFQALEKGEAGNELGIMYSTDADPSFYADPDDAEGQTQDFTSVRYLTNEQGQTIMVVHLATKTLPSCPDEGADAEAAAAWRAEYPVYSCTSALAVTTTAGDVIQAIIDKNTGDPARAVLWPSMEKWPDGWDSSAKVGPTDGVVWLSGGNDEEDAAKHGVNLKFIPDGTAMQVGDVFEVQVGWYSGDDKNIDINSNSNQRTTMNSTGTDLFGAEDGDDNILNTVQRLIWALEHNDSELIGAELPRIKAAIEKVTTLETKIGTMQIRNQFTTKNLDQAKYSSETYLSQMEDADFSQLITDLKNAQTVYEALLGSTGLTSRVSLLNYL